jgi:hypothetical protein
VVVVVVDVVMVVGGSVVLVANVVVVMAERAGSARVSWGSSAPPIPVASATPAMPTIANAPAMAAAIRRVLVPSPWSSPDGVSGPSSSS